ncbi:DNA-directed RNA polymerase specialized sigma24 family protein [Streptomyces sp. PanSC19]|uniref:helix-turn-helix domain-containing protein n=1 Tax=Streptomyces sp. PanSC19 TaxID=1520455 RepID=UPI000F48EAD6|nr:helix-turn-helix domain-containing protein [Streptomyces sp. PanSC19]ROQ33904.1 DNA-directed RNA polymerase specialized sigma24 family protein [Streptomyces sp. PanSC19]
MSRSTADSASSVPLPTPKERRRLREALALSEEQVAEAMGVTKATVRSWETGRSAPRGRKREAYAKLLGTPEPTDLVPPEAESRTESRAQAQTHAQPPQPQPSASASASASGNVRPRAAVKRAAKPPRAPSPAPVISPGPARKGPAKPPERLRPVTAEAPAEPVAPAEPAVHADPSAPAEPAALTGPPAFTPEEAFDALYAYAAPGLVHQTYLLTGRRGLSREAVEYAFHHAWQHWPEVAVDPDPVGWVRATAYEYALSPWHRLRRTHRHPDAPPAEANRRALLGALLELPPPYRRTVLLYDGLGLDLPETAAETEASTPAAANRLLHARAVLGRRIPELAEPEDLHRCLSALVEEAPTATLPPARAVRSGSERRARGWTRMVLGVTAALIAVTGFTAATAPTRYIPVNAPGEAVNGVPVRGGPQKLGPEDLELRDKLRAEPNPGPERLVPAIG